MLHSMLEGYTPVYSMLQKVHLIIPSRSHTVTLSINIIFVLSLGGVSDIVYCQ